MKPHPTHDRFADDDLSGFLFKDAARKADKSGRFVTEFVSFDNHGDVQLQLIASLNASRLATWGFTAEAELRGVKRYRLSAILDGRTSLFCRWIDGRTFDVADARQKIIEVLNVQNPNDLRTVQPWPSQSRASMQELKSLTNAQLKERGLHIPPFHPKCRTILQLVIAEADKAKPQPTEQSQSKITLETLKELGLTATQEQVDHWNAYVGMSPVEALMKLTGKSPQDLLGKSSKSLQFAANGEIALKARGIMGDVKYSIGTILDPYTGTYYLTEAEFVAGEEGIETEFLRRLYRGMIEIGENSSATTIAVAAAGNAYEYAKLGFLPDNAGWQTIRAQAWDELTDGELIPFWQQLEEDKKFLIKKLLEDQDEHALSALVDLQITYRGRSLGKWILERATGTFSLDLTDSLAVKQAKTYLEAQ